MPEQNENRITVCRKQENGTCSRGLPIPAPAALRRQIRRRPAVKDP